MGTLVGMKVVGFTELWISTTIGSVIGFGIMVWLGRKVGRRMVASPRVKFLSEEKLEKPNIWLSKYGYWIVLANRFLSGTRGVVGFLAGMSKLKFSYTMLFSTLSSMIWNAVLIYLGKMLGNNWKLAVYYEKLYGNILLIILVVIISIFIFWKYNKKKKLSKV
jgi:membrane protein DedA with SNARE-associated domain